MRYLIPLLVLAVQQQSVFALSSAERDFNFELRNKATATVSVEVVPAPDAFRYLYTVANSSISERPIISFNPQLDISATDIHPINPNGWDFVGCCVTDDLERGGTGIRVVGWLYNDESVMIFPGNSLPRFGLAVSTFTIPGIKKFFVESFTTRSTPDCGESCGAEEDVFLGRLTDFFNNSTSGLTLGPELAPTVFDPAALIDRLIALKHQSVSQGWLRGEEFIKKLDKKLEQAKKALAQGKPFKARKKLEQFVKALEEQRKEQMRRQHEASEKGKEEREEHAKEDKRFLNDNAFFLLKVNAEFIISKLPQKPKDKDEERESDEKDD